MLVYTDLFAETLSLRAGAAEYLDAFFLENKTIIAYRETIE
jgi:hypothetical protein